MDTGKGKKQYEPPRIYELDVDLKQAMGASTCNPGNSASGACGTGGAANTGHCGSGGTAQNGCGAGTTAGSGNCGSGGNVQYCTTGGMLG